MADARPVVLFGAGGHARSVTDVLLRLGRSVAAVVDRSATARQGWWAGHDVQICSSDDRGVSAAIDGGCDGVLAIGANPVRVDLARRLLDSGVSLPPIVARTATVAWDADLAAGTVVMEHAHVGPGVVLGLAALVNTSAVIEHDCGVGDGAHCAPGSVLVGSARVGEGAFVGAGAIVLPGVTAGRATVVGAGAVVLGDVPAGATVVGVPARPPSDRSAVRS